MIGQKRRHTVAGRIRGNISDPDIELEDNDIHEIDDSIEVNDNQNGSTTVEIEDGEAYSEEDIFFGGDEISTEELSAMARLQRIEKVTPLLQRWWRRILCNRNRENLSNNTSEIVSEAIRAVETEKNSPSGNRLPELQGNHTENHGLAKAEMLQTEPVVPESVISNNPVSISSETKKSSPPNKVASSSTKSNNSASTVHAKIVKKHIPEGSKSVVKNVVSRLTEKSKTAVKLNDNTNDPLLDSRKRNITSSAIDSHDRKKLAMNREKSSEKKSGIKSEQSQTKPVVLSKSSKLKETITLRKPLASTSKGKKTVSDKDSKLLQDKQKKTENTTSSSKAAQNDSNDSQKTIAKRLISSKFVNTQPRRPISATLAHKEEAKSSVPKRVSNKPPTITASTSRALDARSKGSTTIQSNQKAIGVPQKAASTHKPETRPTISSRFQNPPPNITLRKPVSAGKNPSKVSSTTKSNHSYDPSISSGIKSSTGSKLQKPDSNFKPNTQFSQTSKIPKPGEIQTTAKSVPFDALEKPTSDLRTDDCTQVSKTNDLGQDDPMKLAKTKIPSEKSKSSDNMHTAEELGMYIENSPVEPSPHSQSESGVNATSEMQDNLEALEDIETLTSEVQPQNDEVTISKSVPLGTDDMDIQDTPGHEEIIDNCEDPEIQISSDGNPRVNEEGRLPIPMDATDLENSADSKQDNQDNIDSIELEVSVGAQDGDAEKAENRFNSQELKEVVDVAEIPKGQIDSQEMTIEYHEDGSDLMASEDQVNSQRDDSEDQQDLNGNGEAAENQINTYEEMQGCSDVACDEQVLQDEDVEIVAATSGIQTDIQEEITQSHEGVNNGAEISEDKLDPQTEETVGQNRVTETFETFSKSQGDVQDDEETTGNLDLSEDLSNSETSTQGHTNNEEIQKIQIDSPEYHQDEVIVNSAQPQTLSFAQENPDKMLINDSEISEDHTNPQEDMQHKQEPISDLVNSAIINEAQEANSEHLHNVIGESETLKYQENTEDNIVCANDSTVTDIQTNATDTGMQDREGIIGSLETLQVKNNSQEGDIYNDRGNDDSLPISGTQIDTQEADLKIDQEHIDHSLLPKVQASTQGEAVSEPVDQESNLQDIDEGITMPMSAETAVKAQAEVLANHEDTFEGSVRMDDQKTTIVSSEMSVVVERHIEAQDTCKIDHSDTTESQMLDSKDECLNSDHIKSIGSGVDQEFGKAIVSTENDGINNDKSQVDTLRAPISQVLSDQPFSPVTTGQKGHKSDIEPTGNRRLSIPRKRNSMLNLQDTLHQRRLSAGRRKSLDRKVGIKSGPRRILRSATKTSPEKTPCQDSIEEHSMESTHKLEIEGLENDINTDSNDCATPIQSESELNVRRSLRSSTRSKTKSQTVSTQQIESGKTATPSTGKRRRGRTLSPEPEPELESEQTEPFSEIITIEATNENPLKRKPPFSFDRPLNQVNASYVRAVTKNLTQYNSGYHLATLQLVPIRMGVPRPPSPTKKLIDRMEQKREFTEIIEKAPPKPSKSETPNERKRKRVNWDPLLVSIATKKSSPSKAIKNPTNTPCISTVKRKYTQPLEHEVIKIQKMIWLEDEQDM